MWVEESSTDCRRGWKQNNWELQWAIALLQFQALSARPFKTYDVPCGRWPVKGSSRPSSCERHFLFSWIDINRCYLSTAIAIFSTLKQNSWLFDELTRSTAPWSTRGWPAPHQRWRMTATEEQDVLNYKSLIVDRHDRVAHRFLYLRYLHASTYPRNELVVA